MTADTAIIGAGPAGIVAARELVGAGIEPVVFEQRGGRPPPNPPGSKNSRS